MDPQLAQGQRNKVEVGVSIRILPLFPSLLFSGEEIPFVPDHLFTPGQIT